MVDEGCADESIARHLEIDRSTARRVLGRWMEEGLAARPESASGP